MVKACVAFARRGRRTKGFAGVGSRSLTPLIAALALLSVSYGCSAARVPATYRPPASPQLLKSEHTYKKVYILRAGDQIEVVVRRVPEISRIVTIRPDGYISLPVFNDIEAAGLTIPELTAKLTEIFAKRLVDPEVSIIATQVQPSMVYVLGEVNTPSPIPLRNASTAMQAVAAAGGMRKTAAPKDIAVIRLSDDGYLEALIVNVDVPGQPGPYFGLQQMVLKSEDIVFVPESNRSQLSRFVNDFVNQPLTTANSVFSTYLNFRLLNRY